MTYQTLINVVVIIAVLVLVGWRQVRWMPMNLPRMWIMPVVLLGIGVVVTVNTGRSVRVDAPSVGLLAIEVVTGLAIGAAMGWIARFRRLDTPMQDRHGNMISWQYRTGWIGVALWAGLIALRIGIDLAARAAGFGGLLTSTGVILAVVAANRLANAAVLHHRFQKSTALTPA